MAEMTLVEAINQALAYEMEADPECYCDGRRCWKRWRCISCNSSVY